MAQALWACLRLPSLAMDSTLRQRPPDDRRQALALIDGPAQRRVLAAVNEAARSVGLHAGQSLASARAICPALTVETLDPDLLKRNRDLLAAWAYQYSSQVVTASFDNAVLLEAGASLGLFGPWPRLAARLHEGLDALGFRHHLVLAPNPYAAYALSARHTDLAITTSQALLTALADLPVSCAGIEPRSAGRLERMGLCRLGQLFALPRHALAQRFGPGMLEQLDSLRDSHPCLLPTWQPPARFDARIELDFAVGNLQALLFPLRRLCADLAAFLSARDGGVQRFDLTLQHEDHSPSRLVVGLLAPERDAQRLFELARQHLDRTDLPGPVREMSLRASDLPDFIPERGGLFEQRANQGLAWPQLRERLRARLGEQSVRQLAMQADHRPEHAFRCQVSAEKSTATMPSLPRPAWLLARPIPLRGPLPRILAGPERIESGWWDGGDTRRDYYVVEIANGQRAWAFCAVGERGPFHLHGWFA
ncbi:MAG: DNA polymerase Y family protein [Rhodanobacteraceae bacterium]